MLRKTILLQLLVLTFCFVGAAEKDQLYRLDETLWSLTLEMEDGPLEVRVATPGFNSRAADYMLATCIAEKLKKAKSGKDLTLQEFDLSEEVTLDELKKNWELVDITKDWYDELDSFFGEGVDLKSVRVLQVKQASWIQRGIFWVKSWFGKSGSETNHSNALSRIWNGEVLSLLDRGLFQDPFTELATQAFQTDETPFVAEKKCKGSYRFVIRDQQLYLESQDSRLNDFSDARAAIELYRTYLKRAFAWCVLDGVEGLFEKELNNYESIFSVKGNPEEQFFGYLKCSIGIDFDEMIQNQQPLLPDHVFKCNIGVNNIEMPQVESLFLRLNRKLKIVTFGGDCVLDSPREFYRFLDALRASAYFSLREIRGLYCSFKKFSHNEPLTSRKFKEYLDSFTFIPYQDNPGYGEKIRDLTPQSFHRLMEILFVDTGIVDCGISERIESLFTGRKIIHLGICGYKTMGDRDEYDPCRNLFELLHLYRSLVKGDEALLYELLASVVSKKSLWSHYPARSVQGTSNNVSFRERRVARLIPFPSSKGEPRWYYVDGLLNDALGDFNYVLIPACKGYLEAQGGNAVIDKRIPMIKLYRSTASDSEAESSVDSLLADTNPEKVGSLDFNAGDEYEVTYFRRCTQPLWIGYLILGNVERAAQLFKDLTPFNKMTSQSLTSYEEKKRLLLQFMVWQKFQMQAQEVHLIEKEMDDLLAQLIQKVGPDEFTLYLTKSIEGLEWEKSKIAQDILFIGHSLGGALSQSSVYHFGPEAGRIPLYGCNYRCYAYDTPGVTQDEATNFLQFGRDHTRLLLPFKQRWEIQYQFEYGDLVAQGGECFLGIYNHLLGVDEPWLKLTAALCRPLDSTQDIVLTTMPIHGHRFNQAKMGVDYKKEPLQIEELNELKSDWILSSALREKFGYEWTTPRITETLRRTIPGTFAFAYFWTKKEAQSLVSSHNPEVDKNGVVFCTYKGYGVPRGYVNETVGSKNLVQLLEETSGSRKGVR